MQITKDIKTKGLQEIGQKLNLQMVDFNNFELLVVKKECSNKFM